MLSRITLSLCLLTLGGLVTAQDVVRVTPGLGTLNMAIDSVAAVAEPDLSTTFELEDGGTYVLTATIDYEFPLRIEAEAEAETRPTLRPNVPADGEAFRLFNVRDDIVLRGLYLTNEDALGGQDDRIVRIRAEDVRVVIDDCHLDKATQTAIRVDDPGLKLYITNSIVSNIVNLPNPNNGRGIDDRGQDIDTLVMRNSTFYNLSSRILRDDGGVINYLEIDHITGHNTGSRAIQAGDVIEGSVTNSLFVNNSFLGDDEEGSTVIQFETADMLDSIGIGFLNLYDDPATGELFDSLNMLGGMDSIFVRAGLNGDAINFVSDSTTIYNEPVTFTNAPATPLAYARSFYLDPDNPLGLDDGSGGVDPGETQLPFDFSYSEDNFLFTAGSDGLPIGDLQWFGDSLMSSNFDRQLAATLSLRVFPNPVTDRANFQLELDRAQLVTITLFDQLGRGLRQWNLGRLGAGSQTVGIDLSDLPRGQYFYRLTAGGRFTSGSIVK